MRSSDSVPSTAAPCASRRATSAKLPLETRTQIVQITDVFRARVVDVATDSLMIEVTGTDDKIDGLLEILRPFGLIEVARTGQLAMTRGNLTRSTPARRQVETEPTDAAVSFSV